jgi:hypothetical protein
MVFLYYHPGQCSRLTIDPWQGPILNLMMIASQTLFGLLALTPFIAASESNIGSGGLSGEGKISSSFTESEILGINFEEESEEHQLAEKGHFLHEKTLKEFFSELSFEARDRSSEFRYDSTGSEDYSSDYAGFTFTPNSWSGALDESSSSSLESTTSSEHGQVEILRRKRCLKK